MTFEGQYLTYAEYQQLGGSAIGETPFNLLEYNARMKIDERTFGRLKNIEEIPQEVKLCVNSLIGTIQSYSGDSTKDKTKVSEQIDGYSVQFAGASKEIESAMNSEIENTINTYLCNVTIDNIPVLFRGIK